VRRIISKKEVVKISSLSYTTIWRLERAGRFPARVQLSDRRVGWYEDEIETWLESRSTVVEKLKKRD